MTKENMSVGQTLEEAVREILTFIDDAGDWQAVHTDDVTRVTEIITQQRQQAVEEALGEGVEKSPCQECGAMVYPNQKHSIKDCRSLQTELDRLKREVAEREAVIVKKADALRAAQGSINWYFEWFDADKIETVGEQITEDSFGMGPTLELIDDALGCDPTQALQEALSAAEAKGREEAIEKLCEGRPCLCQPQWGDDTPCKYCEMVETINELQAAPPHSVEG